MSKNGNVLLQATSGYQGGSPLVNNKKQQQTEKNKTKYKTKNRQQQLSVCCVLKAFLKSLSIITIISDHQRVVTMLVH